jgi:hypothetical protein
MEYAEFKNSTDGLKLKVVKRMVIVAFGVIGLCLLMSLIPLLIYSSPHAQPILVEPMLVGGLDKPHQIDEGPKPIEPIAIVQPLPAFDKHSFVTALLIPLAILLSVLGLLAYGTYDTIRLFMKYRVSREYDESMFP